MKGEEQKLRQAAQILNRERGQSLTGRLVGRLRDTLSVKDTPQARGARPPRPTALASLAIFGFVVFVATIWALSRPEPRFGRRGSAAAEARAAPGQRRPITEDMLAPPEDEQPQAQVESPEIQLPLFEAEEAEKPMRPPEVNLLPASVFRAEKPEERSTLRLEEAQTARKEPADSGAQFNELVAGTALIASLQNSIDTDFESPVAAVVEAELRRDGRLLVPFGSRLLGKTIGAANNRVDVEFETLVYPDQSIRRIKAVALELDGSRGIAGKLKNTGGGRPSRLRQAATIAGAVAVETLGGGLNAPLTRGDLLRDRAASAIVDRGLAPNIYSLDLRRPHIVVQAPKRIKVYFLSE